MTRLLTAAFALVIGLLILGHIRGAGSAPRATPPAAIPVIQRPRASGGALAAAAEPSRESGTPTIDLLARLEGRRRLLRAAGYTYFDSLFAESDSTVRRWPDQQGSTFLLAVPPTDSSQQDARLVSLIRRAAASWEAAGLGLHFTVSTDTTGAQIFVRSTPQLGGARAGQTDLQWTRDGAIHSAVITLAWLDPSGHPVPETQLSAVMAHELGHSLGLAHSPDPDDVMYQSTRVSRPSQRDRATLTLLYELPLGTIREVVTR